MARRTRAEALATRERILDTAERVFERKGVSRTTLEDIAAAAGVTRGAIYGHFQNKNAVFVAMFNRVHLPMDALYAKGADDHMDPLGRLRELFVTMLKAVSSRRQDQRVLNILHHKCEFTDDTSAILARFRTMGRKEGRRLRTMLENAVEQGQLPATLDVARAETLFHATLIGLVSNWTLTPRAFPLNTEAEPLVDAYLDMLRLSPALRTDG